MQIIIPVHPLSRKILLCDYGLEPVVIKNHDLLFQQLSYQRIKPKSNHQRLRGALTQTIKIQLNDKLANKLKSNLIQVGYHLYCFHTYLMMKHIEALHDLMTVKEALDHFYCRYKLTEDDFEYDSAYRRWNRWKKSKRLKSPTFFYKYNACLTSRNRKKKHKTLTLRFPVDDAFVETFSLAMTYYGPTYLNIHHSKFIEHLRMYLYYEHGQYSVKAISEKLNAPQRSIYYGIKVIKRHLQQNESFQKFMKQYS